MAETKHTPDWEISTEGKANAENLASVPTLQARIDRLEAEKVELLKACKTVESCWGLTDEILEQIRTAIAKAEPQATESGVE